MAEFRKAKVYVEDNFAGLLEETEEGYLFSYDTKYIESQKPAVSLSLPVQKQPYFSQVLFPFFDGLIPEGWLLNVVVRNWKLSSGDRFGILLASCRDCIGDVRIIAEESL